VKKNRCHTLCVDTAANSFRYAKTCSSEKFSLNTNGLSSSGPFYSPSKLFETEILFYFETEKHSKLIILQTSSFKKTKTTVIKHRLVWMLNSVRFVIRISCVLTLFLVGCKDRELEFADRSSQFDDPLPTTSLWDFSDPSQYTFNSNFIEVSGGSAQLKTVDQSLSGVDFIPGRHVGTKLDPVSNRLTISDRNDSSLSIPRRHS
jgi:hypothetical protein